MYSEHLLYRQSRTPTDVNSLVPATVLLRSYLISYTHNTFISWSRPNDADISNVHCI